MKIFICTSKYNYDKIDPIKKELEKIGHVITLPNSYDDPLKEEQTKTVSEEFHNQWKNERIKEQIEKVKNNDAVLVLNFDKGEYKNYIGGAVFLEIFQAWELNKKIFLYNPIPEGILKDEIQGLMVTVINQDLNMIK